MQDDSGAKRILSIPLIYQWFQNLIGAKYARKWLAETYWKACIADKVVDIGCGPGVVFKLFPESVEYVGFDASEQQLYVRIR